MSPAPERGAPGQQHRTVGSRSPGPTKRQADRKAVQTLNRI